MNPWNPNDSSLPPGAAESLLKYSMIGQASQPASTQPSAPEKSLVQKLQDIVTLGRKFLQKNKKPAKDILIQKVKQIRFLLFSLFGKEAVIVKNVGLILKETIVKGLSTDTFAQVLSDVESLSDFLGKLGASSLSCQISHTSPVPATNNIFIIHGHDRENALLLAHFLREDFGLRPIVMLSEPGKSRPLTDKFEEEAQTCSFVFALFTPDDEVFNSAQTYNQARPNVIYETGWFIGRLGRQRVILILKDGAEIHSDLHGVSQVRFINTVEEKFREIQQELRAAEIIV